MPRESRPKLSNNLERNIVQLVGQGYRKREIAVILSLREEILNAHLINIFRTLGVCDLMELTLYAMVHRVPADANWNSHESTNLRFRAAGGWAGSSGSSRLGGLSW